jgi:beta-N-acetylhexosaminidase
VDELVVPSTPSEQDIAAVLGRARDYDCIMVGTLNAFSQAGQAALVSEIMKLGLPTVVVAMRLPYDLMAFPEARTYVCTYSVMEPSMKALAAALFGASPFQGKLPVSIPGMFPAGYSKTLSMS